MEWPDASLLQFRPANFQSACDLLQIRG